MRVLVRRILKRLLDEILKIVEKRNIVIHGNWSYALADLEPIQDSIATKKSSGKIIKASEIMSLAHEFSSYQHSLLSWYVDYLAQKNTLK